MSIFASGKRAARLPEIQNSIKLKDLSLETYLTRKSTKNYACWCISQLLEPSGRRVMADVNLRGQAARCWMTPESIKVIKFNDLGPGTYLNRKSVQKHVEN